MSKEIKRQNQFAEDACFAFSEPLRLNAEAMTDLKRKADKVNRAINIFCEAVSRRHFRNSRYDKSKNRI